MAKKDRGKSAPGVKKAAKDGAKAAKADAKGSSTAKLATKAAKPPKAAKAPAPEAAAKPVKRKAKPAAATPVLATPAAVAPRGRKALKSVKASALGLLPSTPPPPSPSLPDNDVKAIAHEIGGRIMTLLETPDGRVGAAELMRYLATALTRTAAPSRPAGGVEDAVQPATRRQGRKSEVLLPSSPPT